MGSDSDIPDPDVSDAGNGGGVAPPPSPQLQSATNRPIRPANAMFGWSNTFMPVDTIFGGQVGIQSTKTSLALDFLDEELFCTQTNQCADKPNT